jgi:hypothetical protein
MNGLTVAGFANAGVMPALWKVSGIGDFDGDGKADILWRHVTGTVALWLMNGQALSFSNTFANIWPEWSIACVGDFNGDGHVDILWRNIAGNVTIWLMDGTTITSYSALGNVSDRLAQ